MQSQRKSLCASKQGTKPRVWLAFSNDGNAEMASGLSQLLLLLLLLLLPLFLLLLPLQHLLQLRRPTRFGRFPPQFGLVGVRALLPPWQWVGEEWR